MNLSKPNQAIAIVFSSVLFISSTTGYSQEALTAATTDSSTTNASFSIGLSLDGGASFTNSTSAGTDVEITGVINPDPSDIGKTGEIIILRQHNGQNWLLDTGGVFQLWGGAASDISFAAEDIVLGAGLEVDIFNGAYSEIGEYSYFIGYQLSSPNVIVYSSTPALFEVTKDISDIDIIADSEAVLSEEIAFSLNPDLIQDGVTYTWDFADGTVSTGSEVTHSYADANRYLVSVTRSDTSDIYYHYINIGRAFEDTAFSSYLSQTLAPVVVNRDFTWNDCDANWETYDSKYHKLYVESSSSAVVSDEFIMRILLLSDYLFDTYSEIIGWEFMHEPAALDTYLCDDIPGGGTGTGGSFYGIGVVPEPGVSNQYVTDFGYLPHEMLHLWDFRASVWMNSRDPAHAFTTGMEPIVSHAFRMGYNQTAIFGERTVNPLHPDFIFNHYFRMYQKRYLDNPGLDWNTFNSDEFLNLPFESLSLPENKEHMMLPGSLLMSIYQMHGLEKITALFAELEKTMLSNPSWTNGGVGYESQEPIERVQIFMDAMAHALKLDVSDYFEFWKYPSVSNAVSSQYPKSDKINDHDGDGFSPLQGDFDDEDASVFPYAPEIADGKDNNLDGLIDEHVFTESNGDIGNLSVSLPFAVHGSISTLEDEDSFTFTMPHSGHVILNIFSKDSDTSVEYEPGSAALSSVFMGSAWMDDDHIFPVILEAISAPHVFGSWYLDAGVHTLKLNTDLDSVEGDLRNPNPGDYEVQVFINSYEPEFVIDNLFSDVYPEIDI